MKKLLAATAVTALLSAQTFAGDASMNVASDPVIEDPAPMGSAATWIIPLLAIGLIALAISGDNQPVPSDSRLKTDIVPQGFAPNGLPLYSFSYVGGTETYLGVMAQDVLAHFPDAVVEGPFGYLLVDYTKLGMEMQTLN